MKTKPQTSLAIIFAFVFAGVAFSQQPLLWYDFEEESGNYANKGTLATAAAVPSDMREARSAPGEGVAKSRAWKAGASGSQSGYGRKSLTLEQEAPELAAPASFTISFWYNSPGELISGMRFCAKSAGSRKQGGYKHGYMVQTRKNAQTIQLCLGDGGKETLLAGASPFYGLKNTWVFFAVTCDEKTGDVKFYAGTEKIPSRLVSTGKYKGTIAAASSAPFTIGNFQGSKAPAGFVGMMDNFRFYDTALTARQIASVHAADLKK